MKQSSLILLLGKWQSIEGNWVNDTYVVSVETIEFKADGTCVWSQKDNSEVLVPSTQFFKYHIEDNKIVFQDYKQHKPDILRFQLIENVLTIFYDATYVENFCKISH